MNDGENDMKVIVSIGTRLIKLVTKIDSTFKWMLINTYFVCILGTTANLYSSTTILFNRGKTELWLSSAANFLIALLTISRLWWVTNSSHELSTSMKKCAHHFDRFIANKEDNAMEEMQLLKQDLKYHSESPINPISAFSVSNSTLVGAFGTVITYLIVLLQFKVSE